MSFLKLIYWRGSGACGPYASCSQQWYTPPHFRSEYDKSNSMAPFHRFQLFDLTFFGNFQSDQALPLSMNGLNRSCLLSLFMLYATSLVAQDKPITSHVYNWNDLKVEKSATNEKRQILEGGTVGLEYFEIHTSTVEPGQAAHASHTHDDLEELIIIKEGRLKVMIKDQTKILGPGSVALAMTGDEHAFSNGGETVVTYYVLRFRPRTAINKERGLKAGGSFMVNWDDVAYVETEKGGRRQIIDRATTMFGRFEMHVTTLNKGQVSHAPHKHLAEEVIILIRGYGEMQIGDMQIKAEPGALVFLESQVAHALKNTGDGPCEYFAFQWQ